RIDRRNAAGACRLSQGGGAQVEQGDPRRQAESGVKRAAAVMMRLILAAALAASFAAGAHAQAYPTRPVTLIVPYPAGGPTDQLARVIAPKFSDRLGQNFVVENVSGGGTTIATARVARAAGDGYTLLLHNLQIAANVSLYPKLAFDTEK